MPPGTSHSRHEASSGARPSRPRHSVGLRSSTVAPAIAAGELLHERLRDSNVPEVEARCVRAEHRAQIHAILSLGTVASPGSLAMPQDALS